VRKGNDHSEDEGVPEGAARSDKVCRHDRLGVTWLEGVQPAEEARGEERGEETQPAEVDESTKPRSFSARCRAFGLDWPESAAVMAVGEGPRSALPGSFSTPAAAAAATRRVTCR